MLSIFPFHLVLIITRSMKIFCPVKFLRSIMMRLKLLLRCAVINVSPKVEFNEPNKRFRVEDKFAVLLGELPDDSCHSKVLGHSRRIVSNCSITQGLPSISLSMPSVSRAECIRFPVQGSDTAATSRAIIPASDWLRGAAPGTNGRPGEAAVAWSVAAGWDHPSDGAGCSGRETVASRPTRPLKNGCKSSGGPT